MARLKHSILIICILSIFEQSMSLTLNYDDCYIYCRLEILRGQIMTLKHLFFMQFLFSFLPFSLI